MASYPGERSSYFTRLLDNTPSPEPTEVDYGSASSTVVGGRETDYRLTPVGPSINASAAPVLSSSVFKQRSDSVDEPVGEYSKMKASHERVFDFTTIDWFSDRAKLRRFRHLLNEQQLQAGWHGKMILIWHKAQGWVVLFLVALCTAVTASIIHTATEWLTEFKVGYCAGHGWWVNHRICCVDAKGSSCPSWNKWHEGFLGEDSGWWFDYFIYCIIGTSAALMCAWLVKSFAHFAAGSGLPEVKTILGGYIIKRFLGFWTFFVKSLGLSLAVGSGLNVGKEGPLVHVACCIGNLLSRFFSKYNWNEAKKREVLSASAAAGVSAAFGAPLGGVLFSLEAVSTYFPYKTMWRSFFCAIMSTLFLRWIDPFSTGKLVQFQVDELHEWNWIELIPFIFLGVIGGLAGALFNNLNTRINGLRNSKRWFFAHPMWDVCFVALLTMVLNFPNPLVRGSSNILLQRLFGDCPEDRLSSYYEDPDRLNDILCGDDNIGHDIAFMCAAAAIKLFLCILAFGMRIPTGLFLPSMTCGACIGRIVGRAMEAWWNHNHHILFFELSCSGKSSCIFPGIYAIVGAAAVLAGVTRMTVSLAVIMFELTGGLQYIIPLMIALTVSKWVGDSLGREGIYDRMTTMAGYPHIDPKMEVEELKATAADIMCAEPICVTTHGETLASLEAILLEQEFHGFPIVATQDERQAMGYISRADLQLALQHAREELEVDVQVAGLPSQPRPLRPAWSSHSVHVNFSQQPSPFSEEEAYVDFSAYVDRFPVTVGVDMPTDRILDMFQGLGLRYVFVTGGQANALAGMIKKKDLLAHLSQQQKFFGIGINRYKKRVKPKLFSSRSIHSYSLLGHEAERSKHTVRRG